MKFFYSRAAGSYSKYWSVKQNALS